MARDYTITQQGYSRTFTVTTGGGGGAGDMLASTYDPTSVEGDAFAMDNMVEGADSKILTAAERAAIAANTSHTSDTSNPHSVTATQVGLGNVDNTADADKPISTATQTSLDDKADDADLTSHTGNTSNPHSVTAAQVGLGSVDNTADADKPVSTATQAAIDLMALGECVKVAAPSGTPATDLSNIESGMIAANTASLPLLIDGSYIIADPWVITNATNNQTVVFSEGSSITQSDKTKNAIEFSDTLPPNYLTFHNLTLFGTGIDTGAAASTAAGVYAVKNGGADYFGGDYTFIGGSIVGFHEGFDLRNVVKVSIDKFEVKEFHTAFYMDKWDTYLITNIRAVNTSLSALVPGSRVVYSESAQFGGRFIMGEFGGRYVNRLAEFGTRGTLRMDSCNVEGMESKQGITGAGSSVYFTNGRYVPWDSVSTDVSFISLDTSSNAAGAVDITGSSISSQRVVENFGGDYVTVSRGSSLEVDLVDARGGTISESVEVGRDERWYKGTVTPISSFKRGEKLVWMRGGTGSEYWMDNPMLEVYDSLTGGTRWVSTNNDFLMKVLATSTYISASTGTSTPITTALLPNQLSNTGSSVTLRMAGTLAANANAKRIQVKIDGTVRLDTGSITSSGGTWRLECHLHGDNSAGSGARYDGIITVIDSGGTVIHTQAVGDSGDYEATEIDFAVELTTTAAGDLTSQNGKITWMRGRNGFSASE